jgi:hypothetical protein
VSARSGDIVGVDQEEGTDQMPAFEVESHALSTCVERCGDEAVVTRLLELVGPALEGDVQHRALITFSDRARVAGGAVGHLSERASGGSTVVGWLPASAAVPVIDLLERGPVVVRYRLSFGSARSGLLDRLRIDPLDGPSGRHPQEPGLGQPSGAGSPIEVLPGPTGVARRPHRERSDRAGSVPVGSDSRLSRW